jgi:cephalosporin-C deacetylase
MPVVDLPLDKLLTYQGSNPRPDDFDEYWKASVAELDLVDPQVELRPNPSIGATNVECFDLYFTGVGGARIYAKYLRPLARSGPCPALLVFHGYTDYSGNWTDYLSYVSEGFCVAALDCRGQGGQSQDVLQVKGTTHHGHIIRGLDDPDPKNLLFRFIYLDTALLARIVGSFPEVDAERLAATGVSQGGGLTLACAALEPQIKYIAPVYPFLCDYKRVWFMDLGGEAYAEITKYFRHFDPTHQREEEIFTKLGYIDIQHLASRIKAKTLFSVGLMDTICPPSSQFAAYNKMQTEKELVIYPDFGHENLPGNPDRILHFMMGVKHINERHTT